MAHPGFPVATSEAPVSSTAKSNADASTATLGKTAGKDAVQGKSTYVTLMGLARAKDFAEELRKSAHAALKPLGTCAARLEGLADFIVRRRF